MGHSSPLPSGENTEIYLVNFMKEGNVQGGFNWHRANLSLTRDPFTQLDRTVSDVPMTFLHGNGDPVVPSTVSAGIPKY